MSMISGQCDKLRELANKLLEHGAFVGFGGTVNTDPLMLDAGTAMIDAAELILELRDDLQRANAAVQDAEHDESVAWDMVRKAEAENAKLKQELEAVGTAVVRGLHMAYVGALNECESMDAGLIWDHCEMVDAELAKSHARFEVDRHRFDAAISELGVEVDR